mmetsp:Transcript_32533/g.104109  ORF Transcript_32533/g.104109 Transcript_32533/m.104109 type:complete len:206 (-) Transcript_32533:582-1199(-)
MLIISLTRRHKTRSVQDQWREISSLHGAGRRRRRRALFGAGLARPRQACRHAEAAEQEGDKEVERQALRDLGRFADRRGCREKGPARHGRDGSHERADRGGEPVHGAEVLIEHRVEQDGERGEGRVASNPTAQPHRHQPHPEQRRVAQKDQERHRRVHHGEGQLADPQGRHGTVPPLQPHKDKRPHAERHRERGERRADLLRLHP